MEYCVGQFLVHEIERRLLDVIRVYVALVPAAVFQRIMRGEYS